MNYHYSEQRSELISIQTPVYENKSKSCLDESIFRKKSAIVYREDDVEKILAFVKEQEKTIEDLYQTIYHMQELNQQQANQYSQKIDNLEKEKKQWNNKFHIYQKYMKNKMERMKAKIQHYEKIWGKEEERQQLIQSFQTKTQELPQPQEIPICICGKNLVSVALIKCSHQFCKKCIDASENQKSRVCYKCGSNYKKQDIYTLSESSFFPLKKQESYKEIIEKGGQKASNLKNKKEQINKVFGTDPKVQEVKKIMRSGKQITKK